ncbi:YmfL family putative regulatory protein [Massilia aerilata]|uniref:YmfL family putative regulatory protein n=1 Tax=Massilia aerilata TaxID=453817 RepID=A0ABW0RTW5_9BURK
MELLTAYQEMIKVHSWVGTAAMLGMSRSALEARVYEVKGSGMRVETALLIQAHAGTKHFAQAVAAESGGVFVELPEAECIHGLDLEAKSHELVSELGHLLKTYSEAKKDGEIDKRERAELEDISQQMHKALQELMSLMFHVYCRKPAERPADDR